MNPQPFFDACRAGVMGPALDRSEVAGAEAILAAMAGAPLAWCAYALATAWHETAHTMQPIRERGGPNYFLRLYDPEGQRAQLARAHGNCEPGDGERYCGRGYVQLTWRSNYRKLGELLGLPLEQQPGLAMRPDVAARILRRGMEEGHFTGAGFARYLPVQGPATLADFERARAIVNGSDCARLIADYAMGFQQALQAGGWA